MVKQTSIDATFSALADPTRRQIVQTLLKGEANHDWLRGARALGGARTPPEYDLVHLGHFPALVRGGETVVAGEVYAVSDRLLARLDHLEGHPEFYRREWIALDSGEGVLAYLLDARRAAGMPRISSGDWRTKG